LNLKVTAVIGGQERASDRLYNTATQSRARLHLVEREWKLRGEERKLCGEVVQPTLARARRTKGSRSQRS